MTLLNFRKEYPLVCIEPWPYNISDPVERVTLEVLCANVCICKNVTFKIIFCICFGRKIGETEMFTFAIPKSLDLN